MQAHSARIQNHDLVSCICSGQSPCKLLHYSCSLSRHASTSPQLLMSAACRLTLHKGVSAHEQCALHAGLHDKGHSEEQSYFRTALACNSVEMQADSVITAQLAVKLWLKRKQPRK